MKSKSTITIIVLVVLAFLLFGGCNGYNKMNGMKQQVGQAWSDVENQYKRRADLIPNLVNTVKGAANFEQETLTKVIEARSKATSIQLNADDLTPEKLQQFQAAQDQLKGSLSRLMVVAEQYPTLTATQNFQNLQVELSNTENKIATERSRFNEVVKNYNTSVTNFPNVLYAGLLGFKEKGYFTATEEEKETPKVDFQK